MFWQEAERRLREVCDDAPRELAYFAEQTVGLSADRFSILRLTGELKEPSEAQKTVLNGLIARRCAGEPLQYLLGRADFYGRVFSVRPGVLIPRFDTEILVQEALALLRTGDRVLDLCAGSGCVGLTLGAEKAVAVTCVEKFDGAFAVLEQNRKAICPSAKLYQADVLTDRIPGKYEMITANPPYIPTGDLKALSPEVQREPVTALDGGEDGLAFYRVLARRCREWLISGGYLLWECGIGQADATADLLRRGGYTDLRIVRDYGGVPRVVCGRYSVKGRMV